MVRRARSVLGSEKAARKRIHPLGAGFRFGPRRWLCHMGRGRGNRTGVAVTWGEDTPGGSTIITEDARRVLYWTRYACCSHRRPRNSARSCQVHDILWYGRGSLAAKPGFSCSLSCPNQELPTDAIRANIKESGFVICSIPSPSAFLSMRPRTRYECRGPLEHSSCSSPISRLRQPRPPRTLVPIPDFVTPMCPSSTSAMLLRLPAAAPHLRAVAGHRLRLSPRVERRQRLRDAAPHARAEDTWVAEAAPRKGLKARPSKSLKAGETGAYDCNVRFDDTVPASQCCALATRPLLPSHVPHVVLRVVPGDVHALHRPGYIDNPADRTE